MEIDQLINHFEKLYIDRDVLDMPVSLRMQEHFPNHKIEIVEGEPLKQIKGELSSKEFQRSKRLLHITRFKGQFFKRCPGARPGLTCCNYFVLNLGLQCHMNCSYCYLQSFINNPISKIYANLGDAIGELEQIQKDCGDQSVRIGTGEVIDSLALDPLTLYSHDLINFFKKAPNWKLEFKTKTNFVDQFLDIPHAGNVIVSWSINPQNIIAAEEHGTASLDERLEAARKCRDKGFQISFHIDPMIWHQDWKSNYKKLVDAICESFDPKEVPVMSVGALRFQPEQRHMMRERFQSSPYVSTAEVFPSSDGKLRYDHRLREEMFQFVVNEFKSNNKSWNVFLCMETPETWLKSQNHLPKADPGIKDLFNHQVLRKVAASSENSMDNSN